MKKLLISAIIALLPISAMSATILGFQAGAGVWEHDPSGSIKTVLDGNNAGADLKNDLGLSEEQEGYFYFIVEHPVPIIPNFKYVNTKLTSSGAGVVNFTFDGKPYTAGVNTKIDLNQDDFILYYEVLDNIISLDVGLNAKKVEGQVVIDADVTPFSETIPMLYAAAEVVLPLGFALAADVSYVETGGDSVSDITAKVTYTTSFMLGIEAGVRSLNIDVDGDNIKADVEFSGIFAGVYFKF